ncbi:MAG TPA: response regulator transcription factor [Blastocatellia bacterium]|nr:response regulator transcription factor [Blastocatellia bacterium]
MTQEPATLPLRILLVDDSADFLNSVGEFLSFEPWLEIVGRAKSGREAVARSLELWPDLVLMDISMPEMTGLEATRLIRSYPAAPRIVVMTLSNDPLLAQAAGEAGADGFVRKTDLETRLLPLIRRLFNLPEEIESHCADRAKLPLTVPTY